MSNLEEHAKRELELAGLFDKNSAYDGMLGAAVMELIQVFADQEHSGMSALIARELFAKLSNFENLTKITDNADEWRDVSGSSGKPLWQSMRNSKLFSEDGGKTYSHIDDGKTIINSEKSK